MGSAIPKLINEFKQEIQKLKELKAKPHVDPFEINTMIDVYNYVVIRLKEEE